MYFCLTNWDDETAKKRPNFLSQWEQSKDLAPYFLCFYVFKFHKTMSKKDEFLITMRVELIWVRAYTLLTPHMGNHLQLPYLLAHLHASNNSKKFKYGKNRLNILDLKILQVFFTNRGEILVFEKMLNFLSFLVLLYVSGHSKQKNFSKFFWKFYKCFSKPGGNFIFEKNVEFLVFYGYTLCFRTFQAKKDFKKIFSPDL